MRRVAVIGAGAAGCFCAANLLENAAGKLAVSIFEAHPSPMEKLRITGGGRCNLTNDFGGIRSLKEAYPRGERLMGRLLKQFSNEDCCRWFESRGVPLVTQEDHCVFPASQDAADIVGVLEKGIRKATLHTGHAVKRIGADGSVDGQPFDHVVVTSGGAPKGLPLTAGLDLEWVPTVPSLFSLSVRDKALCERMGLVVQASVSLCGSPHKASGPLLITDWGLSGPAILRLSSYAARELAASSYKGEIAVNWMDAPEADIRARLEEIAVSQPRRQLSQARPLPERLWTLIMERAGLRSDIRWGELGSKGLRRLVSQLSNDRYAIDGRPRFRDEFVTAGGIALTNLVPNTVQSRKYPWLLFAGEVLDIDAITGGFNLQAAWSTGWAAAQSILKSL